MRCRDLLATLIGLSLIFAAPAVFAEDMEEDTQESGVMKALAQTFDGFVLRPLGLASTIAGISLFIPSAILTAPSELIEPNDFSNVREAYGIFIQEPVEYTFTRPLGDF